ncbi:MAG: hypothetical protein QOK26_2310 [Pseudonocardiales bacterium]|jgi:hypothetical protein|nr:hypothetical protein [Pseudonocardiales bacterium]
MVTPMGGRAVPHVLIGGRFSAAWGAVERQDLPCLVVMTGGQRGLGKPLEPIRGRLEAGKDAVVTGL